MRRWIVPAITMILVAGAVHAQASFTAHIGTNIFRYERAFLATGASLITGLGEQMELQLGGDFAIAREAAGAGEYDPIIVIPINAGLNFTFPADRTVFYLGTGVTPNIRIAAAENGGFGFFLGPYLKAGLRFQVHEVMSVFLDLQQDLLIGGPVWINTSTRILTGIFFSIP